MSILSILSERAKSYSTIVASVFGIIASIGGAVLYVETNYAHANDVKTIVRNQSLLINQNMLFQLEYYDDRIKKLEMELSRNQEILSDPQITRGVRAYTRRPQDIQDEIRELKSRREILKSDFLKNNQSNK